MRTILYLFLIILFPSCLSNQSKQLEKAFELAYRNRQELEKISEYCQNEPDKLSAVHFLIKNMTGKQVIDSNSIKNSQLYFDALTFYFNNQGRYKNDIQYIICDSIKQLYPYA